MGLREAGKMNILIVTYSYAPMNNTRAFRLATIAEYWASQGHHIDVVCTWKPGLSRRENISNAHIHRVGSTSGLVELLRNETRLTHSNNADKDSAKSTKIKVVHGLKALARWGSDHAWRIYFGPITRSSGISLRLKNQNSYTNQWATRQ